MATVRGVQGRRSVRADAPPRCACPCVARSALIRPHGPSHSTCCCARQGMLTMGFAIAKAGIIPALCMMALSAFLNRFTLLLNLLKL